VVDGETEVAEGDGDGFGVSECGGGETGGAGTGADPGPFDPVTEPTVCEPQPVTPTSTTSAHPTATRKRIPIRRTHPHVGSTAAGTVARKTRTPARSAAACDGPTAGR